MHSSARIKPMISIPKEESYRGYRASPPVTGHYASGEVYTQQRSLPTYRASPLNYEQSENGHYLQKNMNAPGYYKTKKPVEMTDIYENDRILDLNYSDFTPYGTRSYNYSTNNSHNIPRSGIPFLSTKAASKRDDEQYSDSTEMYDVTNRGTPSTRRAVNNTYFMAEKVYSMKVRSQGIMASLVPIGKSKNVNQPKQSSAKGINSAYSQLGLRDAEEYSAYLDASLIETPSAERYALQKNVGTSSQKSLGTSNIVKKGMNMLQSSVLKRENSCTKIAKSPERKLSNNKSMQNDRSRGVNGSQAQPTSYRLLNAQKKERGLNALQQKLDTFCMKIGTTMWQICQRNKRIVLVLLLEKLHHHKLRVTQCLERRNTLLKSRFFIRWKKTFVEAQQEKAEQEKSEIAVKFYQRKLTKRIFKLLKTLDSSQLTTPKTNTSTRSKSKTPRASSISLVKPLLPQNSSTPRNISQPRSATPQNKTKYSLEKVKSVEKPTKEKKSTLPTTPKQKASMTPKSKSAEKPSKGAPVPLASRTSSLNQLAKSESEIIETPAFRENQIRFPTFGKAANFYYEPYEIQELTELSQSPQKELPVFQNSGLDQSFGFDSVEYSSPGLQGGFDTILADILQAQSEPESALSIIPQPIKKEEFILALPKLDIKQEADNKNLKKKSSTPKQQFSTIRSARDFSSRQNKEKDFSRSYSLSARLKREANKTTVQSIGSKTKLKADLKNNLESEKLKTEKAKGFYNRKLSQKALEGLMCGNNRSENGSQDLEEDMSDKIKIADAHYYNNLKIKILSGLLENYVHAYKDKERCKKHYETNLLKTCFSTWSGSIEKTRNEEDQVSESTYNQIVTRFRSIVLTEKAMTQWKKFMEQNKTLKQNNDNLMSS